MQPYRAPTGAIAAAFREGRLRVAVYGLGKMGLPLAAAIGIRGAHVIGADIEPTVVKAVSRGECHIRGEADVPAALRDIHAAGRLEATTDLVAAARGASVHIVIVPTLLREPEKTADMSIVEDVCRAIGAGLKHGDIVLQESTTPPGTTLGLIRETLERASGLVAGRDFGLAFCPERTLSGRALHDILRGHVKVVGGIDEASTTAAGAFYEVLNEKGVMRVSSPTVAEAVKVFEGVYRDVNIALANELYRACEEWGIDWQETFATANSQPYCHIHRPGLGVGGHCIPVYPWFVMRATQADLPLTRLARDVNDNMVGYWVGRAEERAGGSLRGKNVLVVGVTYRPGVAETRYSPALRLIDALKARGANVRAEDPLVSLADTPKPEAGWSADIAIVNHGKPEAPSRTRLDVGAPDELRQTRTG